MTTEIEVSIYVDHGAAILACNPAFGNRTVAVSLADLTDLERQTLARVAQRNTEWRNLGFRVDNPNVIGLTKLDCDPLGDMDAMHLGFPAYPVIAAESVAAVRSVLAAQAEAYAVVDAHRSAQRAEADRKQAAFEIEVAEWMTKSDHDLIGKYKGADASPYFVIPPPSIREGCRMPPAAEERLIRLRALAAEMTQIERVDAASKRTP